MRWRGWVLAASVAAALIGAWTPGARAAAVDCWLLDEARREQAADRGLCDDAFSRNSRPGEAPALGKTASLPEPPSPTAKPPKKPPPRAARARSAPQGPHLSRGTPVRGARAAPDSDFASSFQRDFGALIELLGGRPAPGGRPRDSGGLGLPSHSGR